MGRGNFCANGKNSDQWYIDNEWYEEPELDENGEETGETWIDYDFQLEDVEENILKAIEKRFPSFRKTEKTVDHYWGKSYKLENELFSIGIADNDWSLAVFIEENEENVSWNGYHGLAEKHFQQYREGIEKILLESYGSIYKRGTAWTSHKVERSA